jgi:hypothetical protein
MAVRITVSDEDGEFVMSGPLDEFLAYNDFDGEDCAALRKALVRGETYYIGGGAAPFYGVKAA